MKTRTNNFFSIPKPVLCSFLLVFAAGGNCNREKNGEDCLFPGMKTREAAELPPCGSISNFPAERIEALRTAERIYANVPQWWKVIPDCPCDEMQIARDWIGEPAKQEFHPGASRCYRSPPADAVAMKAAGLDPNKLLPGQQCCYDARNKLITEGAAAGTPDVYAPIDHTSFKAHEAVDVELFQKLGWEIYNLYWPPNNGNNCPKNKKP